MIEHAGEAGMGERASDGAARPQPRPITPEARRYLEAIHARLRRELPDWEERPEDPTSVLLEVWAETLGELHGEISRCDRRALRSLVDATGFEPRGPVPARGAVRFVPSAGARPLVLPAGTAVSTARTAARGRLVFETIEDVHVGPAPVVRAFSVSEGRLQFLPSGDASTGRASTGDVSTGDASTVRPFGEWPDSGRWLYVGDGALATLAAGGTVALEWPSVSLELAEGDWEYSVRDGWKRLEARREVVPAPDVADADGVSRSRLRLSISGPLADLAETVVEETALRWLRVPLPVRSDIETTSPTLLRPGGQSRLVDRCMVTGGAITADLSFSGEALTVPGRPPGRDPCVLFGFREPVAFSLYLECGPAGGGVGAVDALVEHNPRQPRIAWEYSTGDGWRALDHGSVRDRTGGLQRSGSLHVEPPADAGALEVFGERLFWVRARWEDGAFLEAPVVRGLHINAVEVAQGTTLRRVPIAHGRMSLDGWIDAPDFPAGPAAPFDRLLIEHGGEEEVWERAVSLEGAGPEDRWFLLRRAPDGRLRLSFDDGRPGAPVPDAASTIRIESVRAGIGSAGNLPPGTISRLDEPRPGVAGVVQIGPTTGGLDLEPFESLSRRSTSSPAAADRAVTADDYCRLVRAIFPDALRVDTWPDAATPRGILVSVLLRHEASRRLSTALWDALARHLEDASPPGTTVRVVAGTSLPAVLELEFASADAGRTAHLDRLDDLARWAGSVLRTALDPPGAAGRAPDDPETAEQERAVAVFPPEALRERSIRSLISAALQGHDELCGVPVGDIRLVRADLVGEGGNGIDVLAGPGVGGARGRGCYIEVLRVKPSVGGE